MKRLTLLLLVISTTIVIDVKAQCPAGAKAQYGGYLYVHGDFGELRDTFGSVTVYNFPPLQKAYFYKNGTTLLDSLTTNAAGFGHKELIPANCFVHCPCSGTAVTVSPACSVNMSFAFLLPIKLKAFAVATLNNKAVISWQTEEDIAGATYKILESIDGRNFTSIHTINNVSASSPGIAFQYTVPQELNSKRFYRLEIIENSKTVTLSAIKTAIPSGRSGIDIYPSVSNGNFTVTVPPVYVKGSIQVFNNTGKLMHEKRNITNSTKFELTLSSGIYYVKTIAADGNAFTKTILIQ